MKTCSVVFLILALAVAMVPAFAAQKTAPGVPKYDPTTEAVFKGTVEAVTDRQCPVSGGMGSHVLLKLADGSTIEVHLASTKFIHTYELIFNKGDEIEVTGSKVKFEGVDTIFARQVKHGNDTYVFRDKDGRPVW
ncbi:MAG TPA: hypothetical protein VMT28_03915 [Terriglobales bacterium]|jgi:TusA-related sulfurtransferase|nr:hypothetical protein [Terriglobales bacterium]